MPTSSAGLSFVPKVSIAAPETERGELSMITSPIATTSDSPSTRRATNSATASATAAATSPATAPGHHSRSCCMPTTILSTPRGRISILCRQLQCSAESFRNPAPDPVMGEPDAALAEQFGADEGLAQPDDVADVAAAMDVDHRQAAAHRTPPSRSGARPSPIPGLPLRSCPSTIS